MNDPVKLCKDCKHYREASIKIYGLRHRDFQFARCARAGVAALIGGEGGAYCYFERQFGCGTDGKFWEAA